MGHAATWGRSLLESRCLFYSKGPHSWELRQLIRFQAVILKLSQDGGFGLGVEVNVMGECQLLQIFLEVELR